MIKEKIQEIIPKKAKLEIFDTIGVFEISAIEIKDFVQDLYHNKNFSLKLITATDERKENGCFKIWYIFGLPQENAYIIPFLSLKDTTEFPSIALIVHEALNYERKIQTFFGLKAVDIYDSRPLILHENWPEDLFPLRKDFELNTKPADAKGTYDFYEVKGEGIYEIPVGPIHAGIIEPGHFRFSVAGERIVSLEPRLGFTHKGSEKLFEKLSFEEGVKLSEKISGDSSFSHSLAFCQALETLSSTDVPKRGLYLRVIYAEMERLANHLGDIGAIMTDVGFNFGGAQGARLREIVMRMNERITKSRFLRNVNIIGGVTKDIDKKEKERLSKDLKNLSKDFSEVIEIAENSASVLNRLKDTGIFSTQNAKDCGAMGVAGRAAGLAKDVRIDNPYAAYSELFPKKMVLRTSGDVYARFHVRIEEVRVAIKIIQKALNSLPEGRINAVAKGKIVCKKNFLTVSAVEGWRGEIIYFVTTDAKGQLNRVAPRDPSFVNWSALKDAGLNNIVPDFPLINKSFNLSYSGNDV